MRFAVAGVGGLGSLMALCIARSGLAKEIDLYDPDTFEEKNTNQLFFTPSSLGRPKVEVIAEFLELKGVKCNANKKRIGEASKKPDILIDCTDSKEARMEAKNKAEEFGVPYVFSSVSGNEGMTFISEKYQLSLFSKTKTGSSSRSPLPAVMFLASISFNNLADYLAGRESVVYPRVLMCNLNNFMIREVEL